MIEIKAGEEERGKGRDGRQRKRGTGPRDAAPRPAAALGGTAKREPPLPGHMLQSRRLRRKPHQETRPGVRPQRPASLQLGDIRGDSFGWGGPFYRPCLQTRKWRPGRAPRMLRVIRTSSRDARMRAQRRLAAGRARLPPGQSPRPSKAPGGSSPKLKAKTRLTPRS